MLQGILQVTHPQVNVTVQTTPQAPVLPTLKTETDLGVSDSDNITSDSTPTITGTVSPNTQVKIYVDGSLAETVTSTNSGLFESTISVRLYKTIMEAILKTRSILSL